MDLKNSEKTNSLQKIKNEYLFLLNSANTLKEIHRMFSVSSQAVHQVSNAKNTKGLFPLTDLLYAEGNLLSKEMFLVDIGTEFYVEMNTEEANDYFKRRKTLLEKKIVEIENQIKQKVLLYEEINKQLT